MNVQLFRSCVRGHVHGALNNYTAFICALFSYFQPTQSGATLFEPNYYYGFTMFRSDPWHSLYLGCDDNKLATLVPTEDVNYPNPQALFTVNKYKVDLPVID